MAPEINCYITKRYRNWLDYSSYLCSLRTDLIGQGIEVLNEVLLNILQKDETLLLRLIRSKKMQDGKELTEFDFFVLRAIKLNTSSESAPYIYKNKLITRNAIPLTRVSTKCENEEPEVFDNSNYIISRMNEVRRITDELKITPKEKKVFEFKFINAENWNDWTGPETRRELYYIYSKVVKKISSKARELSFA